MWTFSFQLTGLDFLFQTRRSCPLESYQQRQPITLVQNQSFTEASRLFSWPDGV
uniref:Uncharacterized protein n=1 Tax=Anguilla anguilla TaxID=7936 RepID=A0A0E9SVN6_ANGAN